MKDIIKQYIIDNDYKLEGIDKKIIGFKWLARTTDSRSGVFKVGGKKYYAYIIKPWANCPSGEIEIEIM